MFRLLKKCCIALFAMGMVAMFAAEKDLKLGVYIYDYAFRRIAQENGEDFKAFVDRHFKLLKDHGTNAIHLTVSDSTGKQYEEIWQPALRKHGIKAYLQLECESLGMYDDEFDTSTGGQLSNGFRFDFGGITSVENVETENGKEEIFDLLGRKVENPTEGIYIVNGKKVFVK